MQTARKVSRSPMLRFEFLKLANKAYARTFNKDIYQVKPGLLVINRETMEIKRLKDIYYQIRTVRDMKGNILAKRKQPNGDLYKV